MASSAPNPRSSGEPPQAYQFGGLQLKRNSNVKENFWEFQLKLEPSPSQVSPCNLNVEPKKRAKSRWTCCRLLLICRGAPNGGPCWDPCHCGLRFRCSPAKLWVVWSDSERLREFSFCGRVPGFSKLHLSLVLLGFAVGVLTR